MENIGAIIFVYVPLAILLLILLVNAKKLPKFIANLRTFYGEVKFEVAKVTWPTYQEVVNSTVLVIVMVLILTVMVGIVDAIFGQMARLIFLG